MSIATQEERKTRLMREAEERIDAELRREAREEEQRQQNVHVAQLAKQLRELGFKSTLLVLVVYSVSHYPSRSGRTETITLHKTTATQFLFSRSASTARPDYDNLPREGSPDRCFGVTRDGEVRVGYTDNRAPSEVYNVAKHHSYNVLVDIMTEHIERLTTA